MSIRVFVQFFDRNQFIVNSENVEAEDISDLFEITAKILEELQRDVTRHNKRYVGWHLRIVDTEDQVLIIVPVADIDGTTKPARL